VPVFLAKVPAPKSKTTAPTTKNHHSSPQIISNKSPAISATRYRYLGEEGFKDKLLGLIDKASAKVTKRGSVAGAAIRAHGEGEGERIIGVIGAALGLPETIEELRALRKGDPGKVICAALVKANTSVTNEWLTARLCMGHPAAMCQLVSRARKDPKIQKILKNHEKPLKSKD